jgi:hypothetical protein
LGYDSGDESKITAVGLTGKIGDGYDSRSKLFHIRVIMKHTKISILIDSGSQYNLISSIIVPSKVVDLKHEHEMVVGWELNHTFLQDNLMSCKHIKHIGSVSVIFLMLLLLMFSTWMVVDSVRYE